MGALHNPFFGGSLVCQVYQANLEDLKMSQAPYGGDYKALKRDTSGGAGASCRLGRKFWYGRYRA